MEFLTGVNRKETAELPQILSGSLNGRGVSVNGAVHVIRDMGNIVFILLRKRDGLLQCVYRPEEAGFSLEGLREGDIVLGSGTPAQNEKAPGGTELILTGLVRLSGPAGPLPLPVGKRRMNASLETRLCLRPVSLRNLRERARFKIQEGVVRGFRDFLHSEGFTEIHSPKLGARGAEGGANIFKLDYFHRPAVLAQSPQFYKQMMTGVFDRVFEVGPVFRAEKHSTKRHLNEYTSLDFEMGYIDGLEDVMAMETGLIQYILRLLEKEYPQELQILGVSLPDARRIPCVRFREAKRLVSEKYGRPVRSLFDLEPEEEALISRYFKEEYDADFVFVTHYPGRKRPFYAMDDPEDKTLTLSFDCLFRGLEITTGGQRIHDSRMLREKLKDRDMTEEGMEHYMTAFDCGMPPHGGLGIGLERFVMKLLGEDDVREASLFPRDMARLAP